MTWARDKFDTSPFQVVVGVVKGVDFEFASVAGAGINMAYAKGPAQCGQDARFDLTAQAPLIFGRRPGLGDDTDGRNLL